MAVDRRLRATLGSWAVILAIPLVIMFWLLMSAQSNVTLFVPAQHFYIVTVIHLLSLGIAVLVAKAAIETREFRVLLLSMGFMAMSGFFATHAIATPGILMPDGEDYGGTPAGLSAFLSLFVSGALFAASATRFPAFIQHRPRAAAVGLVVALLALVVLYGVAAFVWTEEFEHIPISYPWGSYVIAVMTIGLLAFAAWRNLRAYALARLPMQGALVGAFVLLGEAQVSMAISPEWSLSWWEYHFLMLPAAAAAMVGLLVQYGKTGSLRKIMSGVFELESLVEIELAHAETVAALAAATEAKDPFTKGHTIRVAEVAVSLGKALRVPNDRLRVLIRAGLLHDIGKLGIPDTILLKPGPLTAQEFAVIKEHPRLGFEILERVGSLEQEIAVIRAHHEWVNGGGYPLGLLGDQISLEARIIAVADVYDSLVSDRPYRKGLPLNEVKEILRKESGSHLDPKTVDVCLTLIDEENLPASEGNRAAGMLLPSVPPAFYEEIKPP